MDGLSVSVAMATFNGAAHIDQQLADLAAQSLLPTELVVCDDGSSDDTLAILERFAVTAPFEVHIHRNAERLGYRANFLKCASLCSSDLIAFCDQDDRWAPDKIETMIGCFDDSEVLLAFHDAEIVGEDEQPLGQLMQARPIGASLPLSGSPWTFALGFTQMFRRWLCDCDGWWELSEDPQSEHDHMAHDQWYFFLASALGTIVNAGQSLARYRQHGANVFGWSKLPLTSRLSAKIRSAAWLHDRRLKSAQQRAIILDRAAAVLPPPYAERAQVAVAAYQALADRCAKRAAIYSGSTFLDRARSLASLVSERAYGAGDRRFSASALMMDAVVGLSGLGRRATAHTATR